MNPKATNPSVSNRHTEKLVMLNDEIERNDDESDKGTEEDDDHSDGPEMEGEDEIGMKEDSLLNGKENESVSNHLSPLSDLNNAGDDSPYIDIG